MSEEKWNNYKEECMERYKYTLQHKKYSEEELIDKMYDKDKEIERLNKELEQTKDNFDFNLGAIENIRKENHKLEDKIDKAIEYIESLKQKEDYGNGISLDSYELTTDEIKSLLYLLKGSE